MEKFRGLKTVIIVLVLAVMLLLYFFYISRKMKNPAEEKEVTVLTSVDIALQRNLDTNYPKTPKEVIKYFAELTKVFVNESYTEEEMQALDDKLLGILDDELVAYKTREDYLLDLENYVASFKSGGYKITSYSPSASTDIEYFVEQGYECARGWCQFTIKSGKFYQVQQYVFILRKDEDSHWKIFGWQIVDE